MREGGEGGRGGRREGRMEGDGKGRERGGKGRGRITPYMYSLDGYRSLTLGPEDTQHIPYTGTRGHTTHPS